jgi:quercetin dioxygenase-like cupin family protein
MSSYFPSADEFSPHTIFPGVNIRTCSCEKMMISLVDLHPHAVVAEHSHPHEQIGMVLEGRLILTIGSEEKTLQAGDVFRIPGNVPHKVVTLDQRVKVIDIFHPIREEYR